MYYIILGYISKLRVDLRLQVESRLIYSFRLPNVKIGDTFFYYCRIMQANNEECLFKA